ncbi:MAG TPA: bifunctional demethylmenaquinone methyltransferase/2-methoxy-6-polyprenyl-1,4-benzoquinol methylase UbiE [Acidobacteriota bacterium]|nr:bifunctional demethylmenaquinone methyltransferase/2-methoxy-6-polyprenyl-1,4-benzoquinol methylase UbiE [Acidobacteriota bacterium]
MIKESREIRNMFSAIAPRYDLLNHLLSLSIDRYWRWRTVRTVRQQSGSNQLVLDLCTGTADLAILLARTHRVVGCDFSHPMLRIAAEKVIAAKTKGPITLVEADALRLPFEDAVFDVVTIAFGLRNLEDYDLGLMEMKRVLRPGGTLAVLEFSEPQFPVLRHAYLFYFSRVLPKVGEWISGRPGAYSYLCHSVQTFPDREELKAIMARAGFRYLRHSSLTGGIATLHLACKEEDAVNPVNLSFTLRNGTAKNQETTLPDPRKHQ